MMQLASANAVVIADGNRKTINAVDRFRIQGFPRFAQDGEEREEQIAHTMQASIEPTLAEHLGNEALFFQIRACRFKIGAIEQGCHNRGGNHFGSPIGHLRLRVFVPVQTFEQIDAKTVNGYNADLQGFL